MTMFLVFDVESVGLHGEGFAFGAVVVNDSGEEVASMAAACHPMQAQGDQSGRDWLEANLPVLNYDQPTPSRVRDVFWWFWIAWERVGAIMAADVPWPVESAFLHRCILENLDERCFGPYPLIDVASVRLAAGMDPLATVPRTMKNELPAHDPLADARQSARLLIEALDSIKLARTHV